MKDGINKNWYYIEKWLVDQHFNTILPQHWFSGLIRLPLPLILNKIIF